MSASALDLIIDELADQLAERLIPKLLDAVDGRHLPSLAVSRPEAARALGVHPDTITRLVREGRLDALDGMPGKVVVTVASLHRYAGHPLLAQLHEPIVLGEAS